jgi:hypothetical protein
MACAASITDFIPDAHTLFIVVQATVLGKPAKCSLRAGSLSCSGLNYITHINFIN